jgi:hypothetical protein
MGYLAWNCSHLLFSPNSLSSSLPAISSFTSSLRAYCIPSSIPRANTFKMAHPIQAVQEMAGAAGVDPRPLQRSTLFQGANDGPATVAAQISGVMKGGKRVDDAPYHTNNDGIQDRWRYSCCIGHFLVPETASFQPTQTLGAHGPSMYVPNMRLTQIH